MESIFQKLTFPGQPIDLLKTMQIMFDQASLTNKNLWEQTYVDKWFTTNLPQYGLTAEGIVGKYKLRFLASIIGNDATTPLRPGDGFDTWKGEIPRIGHRFLMEAGKMRKLLEVYESGRITDAAKFNEIQKTIMTDYREAYLGTKDAVDHIVLRALSNGGIADITTTLNPDGRAYKIDYEMSSNNKKQAAVAWDDANVATVDVLNDLITIKYAFAELGVNFGSMLMSPEILHFMMKTSLVRKNIFGTDKGTSIPTVDQFNSLMASNGLPAVQLITKKNAVQKDGVRTTLDPWNHDMVVLLPEGNIGELQPAFEDNEIISEDNVIYTNAGGGIRIAKWRVGESSGQKAGEYTQGSWRVVPIINSIDAIVNLKVRNF
jgi:hypothetical protein